ncbi:V-type proton ATPase 116 kDa subunit a 1-like isoform X1 [Ptychodera flava]|uniref:V-type proton ATPase 116 kDa subunit a 1-like isoform X1 n=1 Tax=Ptychodera flava TaxID=63121 RepID=UPI003969CE9B
MGSLYRSEEMTLAQLFLQSEAAYACVSELGELGVVQFRDLNPDVNAFQRKFVNEVRRCDEMERKLRFLEKEIKKANIPILDTGENPEAPPPREMIDLEATFEKLENEMKEVNTNQEALKRNFLELTELKHILRKTQNFFDEAELHHQQMHDPSLAEESHALLGEEGMRPGQAMRLGFVAGVIPRERIPSFERMLWRACRGNVFLKQAEIESPLEDPSTGDQVHKTVFIIFFQGDQLKSRVKKICEGFRATLYPCPETQAERREMAMGVMTRIEDLQTVLGQTQDHRHRVLASAAKNIKVWFIKVCKIKAIYHTLNLFNLDVTQKCLIAECWCPVADLDSIQQALRRGTERSGSSVPSILNRMQTKEEPPTYNRTNKFTNAFQAIVDAYGVACYREINPAPYTIITFPFLFAVMFGDTGHGLIMALFALWIVIYEKKLAASAKESEMWGTIYGGRYVILLMGLFAIYSGLIYNDIYSKSINLFGSSFIVSHANYTNSTIRNNEFLQLDPQTTYTGSPYPFGFDPIWRISLNELTFTNSFKMKLSVIFGVMQMMFGVFLSLLNHRYFNKPLNIFCEFIPQVLFLFCMFGYLVIMIFIKWFKFDAATSSNAPSLLIVIINMFLLTPVPEAQLLFAGQNQLQVFLVLVVVLCVPWMLFIKPIYLYVQNNKRLKLGLQFGNVRMIVNGGNGEDMAEVLQNDSLATTDTDSQTEEDKPKFDFGDVFILQAIHTIEYCLGCISNTASYLRLWALSLAHAELSLVLWEMVMRIGLSVEGYLGSVVLFGVFAFWAVLTIAILLIMEGLSAFLHALRLHWVEFQNKFYVGDGHLFAPFSFEIIMESKEE